MKFVDFDDQFTTNVLNKMDNDSIFSTIGVGKRINLLQMKMVFEFWRGSFHLALFGIKQGSREIGYIV